MSGNQRRTTKRAVQFQNGRKDVVVRIDEIDEKGVPHSFFETLDGYPCRLVNRAEIEVPVRIGAGYVNETARFMD